MEEFKERMLYFIRNHLQISVRKFEEACSLTNGTIGSIRGQGPTASVLSKIADTYPELSMDWLFRGKGEMLNNKPSHQFVDIGNWDELVRILKGFEK